MNAAALTDDERGALERLIAIAKTDSGQARKVAAFLMAWWNAASCGGFDLTDLWAVDTKIALDMYRVFGLVIRHQSYPDTLGYADDFRQIIAAWRPALLTDAKG
jgi:hypothetical protein